MATTWVCPIDGLLPADNGSNTNTNYTTGASALPTYGSDGQPQTFPAQVNLNGAAAIGDSWGNPPHCPVCGSACIVLAPALVTTRTGVASGSQHPVDVDATYTAQADSPLAQGGATPYVIVGGQSTQPHKYVGSLTRGTVTITAETLNTVVGP